MSSMLVLLCVGWVALADAWSVDKPAPYALEDAELHFEQFIQKFEKNYADENEKQVRFQIFKENLDKINSLNEESKHAVFGITQFSDVSHEEFEFKLGFMVTNDLSFCTSLNDGDVWRKYPGWNYPMSWDWREHNAVTPVKDQKHCRSGYAFSTIGNIESQYAIKHKELIRLSEQQILDCDSVNVACVSGQSRIAMRSLINNTGVEAESDYPYKGKPSQCLFDANKVKVQVTDCISYNLFYQADVQRLVYNEGTLAIAIRGKALQHYTKGIIDDHLCDQGPVNHAVLLVGYGYEDGESFWIVKNSWGTSFGEDGYFRMQLGDDYHSCGMMNRYMTFAIVE